MKQLTCLLVTLFVFAFDSYSQDTELQTCECADLTMQGENNQSAYLENLPFTGECLTEKTDGTITEERNYLNGQLEGELKIFFNNGNLEELTEYSGNMKHGNYLLYSNEGKLLIAGSYKNQLKDGEWHYYDEVSGELARTVEYEFVQEKLTIQNAQ